MKPKELKRVSSFGSVTRLSRTQGSGLDKASEQSNIGAIIIRIRFWDPLHIL